MLDVTLTLKKTTLNIPHNRMMDLNNKQMNLESFARGYKLKCDVNIHILRDRRKNKYETDHQISDSEIIIINPLKPGKFKVNCRRLFRLVFVNEIVVIWFEFYYSYSQRVQLTISQHWLRNDDELSDEIGVLNVHDSLWSLLWRKGSVDRKILYDCMMTASNGNIFYVTGPLCGEFPSQRPATRRIDGFFDLRLNKRLSKQPRGWWFETPPHSLWRHRNVFGTNSLYIYYINRIRLLVPMPNRTSIVNHNMNWRQMLNTSKKSEVYFLHHITNL